jgi:Tfp pilus assembly protein PilF
MAQTLDKAIQLDPDDATAYYNRGLAYRHLGENQRASRTTTKPSI